MSLFFAYTKVRTPAENLGLTCAIYFCFKMYYGTICELDLPYAPLMIYQYMFAFSCIFL